MEDSMNRLIRKRILIFLVILVTVTLLSSKRTTAGETDTSVSSSQGTEAQVMPGRGEPLDEQAQLTNPSSELEEPGTLATDSQGMEVQAVTERGEPLDDLSLFGETMAAAKFYHIPGSVLTPVDSTTQLVYDLMGCVHASAGASGLLNAPLEIPDGSHIVLMRLYYDDTSANEINSWITRYDELGTDFQDLVAVASAGSGGHGSNYGDLDHIVDTYGWSYVINIKLNSSTSALQVCGIRVMYYPPAGCGMCLPVMKRNANP
jgi:hypothetical protein